MRTPTRTRAGNPPASLSLTRLLAELRELPFGLATPVRADYLVADVLAALGYPAEGVAGLIGLDADAVGSGVLEVVRW